MASKSSSRYWRYNCNVQMTSYYKNQSIDLLLNWSWVILYGIEVDKDINILSSQLCGK
jgi:hypothetical protein